MFVEDMEMMTWVNVTPAPAMDRVRDALFKLFEMAAANPFYGRTLPLVLTEAGLEDVWVEGRVAWGYRWDNPGLQMLKLMLMEMREFLVNTGLASGEDIDDAVKTVDDPAWLGMPPMVVAAYGRKPG
ncbi:MAG: hypothetical protein E6G68_04615 [Actinobacteria bacterium]|nr:MAG: hypothetical protein E6G68_04615 [Actinomycetota bacterium]